MPITSKNGLFLSFKSSSTRQVRPKTVHVPLTVGSASNIKCDSETKCDYSVLDSSLVQPVQFNVDENCGSTNRTKRQKLEEDWVAIQRELLNVGLSLEVPAHFNCDVCGNQITDPIRCIDCNAKFICCAQCEPRVHEHVLHKPEIWQTRLFVPYTATSIKVWKRLNHECNSSSCRCVELYDERGRQHFVTLTFCECESPAASFVRYGFWPASPTRPNVGVSMSLLRLMNMLTLECAVSVAGFVQTLRWTNNFSSKEANHLYFMLIGESISHFRNFDYQLNNVDTFSNSPQKNYIKCPVCPKAGGTMTVSMDANFGLVRKCNAGSSLLPPLITNDYFVDSSEVHDFVSNYGNDNVRDKECSNFLAGDAVRSRSRNAKLDVRGVFGSVCRHEFPILFMDMKHGERLAYPVLLLRKLIGLTDTNTSLQAVYDIACILTRHLTKTRQFDLLQRITLGLPVFHAYGHGTACQLNYSTRQVAGFGLTDGEGTERLWSYLRPLSTITKEMTPSRRTDLLNTALHHFAMRKTAGLAQWFEIRVARAADVARESQEKLSELTRLFSVNIDHITSWMNSYKQQLFDNKNVSEGDGREKILWQLLQCAFERGFLISLLSKYCDGQKSAQRLSKQVKVATSGIRKRVDLYNAKSSPEMIVGVPQLPLQIYVDQALDATSDVYLCLQSSIRMSPTSVPLSAQWKAINLLKLRDRAAEEEKRITDDMKCALEHFHDVHGKLVAMAESANNASLQALTFKRISRLETTMSDLWQVARKYVTDLPKLPNIMITLPVNTLDDVSKLSADDVIDLNDFTSTLTDFEADPEDNADADSDEVA